MRPVSKDGRIQVIFSEPYSEKWEKKSFSNMKDAVLFFYEKRDQGKNVEVWVHNSMARVMTLFNQVVKY